MILPLPRPGSAAALVILLGGLLLAACGGEVSPAAPADLPARLSETGLYLPGEGLRLDPRCRSYEPRFGLWTDGATKRRWIRLPSGAAVDGRDPDAWHFPAGTRLWKEFSLGHRIETRLLEVLPDGQARYATYLWRADGSDADRADPGGVLGVAESAPGVPYDLPSEADCRACHDSGRGPVLGFTALQLACRPDGPAKPDVPDLADLVAEGVVRNHPDGAVHPLDDARVPARTRAALGYLAGNCAHCHNPAGPLRRLDLDLAPAWTTPVETLLSAASLRARRLVPGRPETSPLVRRLAADSSLERMPPLGTHRIDARAVELLTAWVRDDLAAPADSAPTPSLENHP